MFRNSMRFRVLRITAGNLLLGILAAVAVGWGAGTSAATFLIAVVGGVVALAGGINYHFASRRDRSEIR
jgi:outer membrane lipoprotein SlyB